MDMNQVRWRGTGAEAESACAAFLARHSAYRDGELSPAEAAAHEAHVEHCASCARYARVLTRGVEVLRRMEEMEPSEDFGLRLQHRLFHVEDEARRPRRRYLPATMMAAAFGALAIVPMLNEGAPAEGFDLHPHEAVFGTGAQLWHPPELPLAGARTRGVLPVAQYSPVVVHAPQYYGGAVTFAD